MPKASEQPPRPVGDEGQPETFRVVEWQRRAAVLTRPKLPCLAAYHALNLTAGCPNECRYCYAQSYGYHPGWGKVAFYANMLDRLRDELPRMRVKPTRVYFSTASEPFLPVPRILDDMYAIMSLLLDTGCRLLISTKGVVEERFARLFASHPGRAHVQIGLTTVEDDVRRAIEPRATCVAERLRNLERLLAHDVAVEARMDPLVPGLTDTDLSFDALLHQLTKIGVRHAVASFLFLRWGIRPPRDLRHGDWSFATMRRLYTHKFTKYCGGGTIRLPSDAYRRERFTELRILAGAHKIRLHLCRCKNPGLTEDCCHPQPPPPAETTEQPDLWPG